MAGVFPGNSGRKWCGCDEGEPGRIEGDDSGMRENAAGSRIGLSAGSGILLLNIRK